MLTPADTFLPWELSDFRATNEARLPHRCLIRRRLPASDSAGSTVDATTDVATALCALTQLERPRELAIGAGFAAVAQYRLLVPLDTAIEPADQVLPWWHWLVSLGAPSGGTWTMTYQSQTTSSLSYQATGAQVQTAMEALGAIADGEIAVRGGAGGPYQLRFRRGKSAQSDAITASFAGLTGGDGVIERASYEVVQTEDGLTDQPLIVAWLTRRRP